jgi:hypothetical protein
LLHELKARGYRIVHVVPATSELPATPSDPQEWQLHPTSENVAITRWPKIPGFAFVSAETLVVPALTDSYWNDDWPAPRDLARRPAGGVPLPREAPWPRQTLLPLPGASALPAPAQSIFEIRDPVLLAARIVARSPRQAEPAASTEDVKGGAKPVTAEAAASRRTIGGKSHAGKSRIAQSHAGRVKHAGAAHAAGRGIRHAAHPSRRALKRVVQIKRRSV